MLPLLPLQPTALLLAVGASTALGSLRLFHPELWRARWLRHAVVLALALPALGLVAWGWSPLFGALGVRVAWTSVVVLLPFAAALLVAGVGRGAIVWLASRSSPAAATRASRAGGDAEPIMGRRHLLIGTSLLPASALCASVGGLEGAGEPARMPVVTMRWPDLHPDLHGLRILHLSDLHLGVSLRARDLGAFMDRAATARPDLIVLTGDVADHLGELAEALRIVHAHRPRLGVFASLGNHEYLLGERAVRRVYEEGPVPLLVDGGVSLEVGDARLWVAGADDPERDHGGTASLERSVSRCAAGAPTGAFRLLLSHRPGAFPAAARRGFHLTLSGHTHGGQVGLFGRSVFESALPGEHLWGQYRRGESRLYTSAGFGHWFPFRLGCPTEAPLIVLERGERDG